MRKTVIIITKTKKDLLYCDRCGKKIPSYNSCYACEKIFCDKHKPKEIEGGYGLPFCPKCTPKVRALSIELNNLETRKDAILEEFFTIGGRGRKKKVSE